MHLLTYLLTIFFNVFLNLTVNIAWIVWKNVWLVDALEFDGCIFLELTGLAWPYTVLLELTGLDPALHHPPGANWLRSGPAPSSRSQLA